MTRATTQAHLAAHPAFPDAVRALRCVLDESGGGAVGVDDMVRAALVGGDRATVPAMPHLRRIRMIKSQHEVGLMRFAAKNNADAARIAIESVGVGSSYEALRNAFFAETGRRGGKPVFMSTDSMTFRQRSGIITEGRAFSIDAVGAYAGYHGDYGRTVVVGEPEPALRRALDAAILCNDAVSKALRPGLHYSDIVRVGQEAVRGAGYDIPTPSSPHSVGLWHTDEAFKGDALTFAKDDLLIEENMILSIDCPMLQTDMGGSVHMEDLWLVTPNGCEVLNDTSHPYHQIQA
jgi:Xaa-Pro aminopeptidase